VNGEDGLAVFAKEHEIGFPVTGHGAVLGLRRTKVNRDAVLEVIDGTPSPPAEATTARLAARQEAVPVVLLSGAMIDETIDGFVGDHRGAVPATQAAGNLLGGPALKQVLAHRGLELRRGGEFVRSTALTAPVGERLGAQGDVAPCPGFGLQAVTAQFARNGGGGSGQEGADRSSRFTVCMQPVNLDPLL